MESCRYQTPKFCNKKRLKFRGLHFSGNQRIHKALRMVLCRIWYLRWNRTIFEEYKRHGYDLKVEGEDTIVVYDAEGREMNMQVYSFQNPLKRSAASSV